MPLGSALQDLTILLQIEREFECVQFENLLKRSLKLRCPRLWHGLSWVAREYVGEEFTKRIISY